MQWVLVHVPRLDESHHILDCSRPKRRYKKVVAKAMKAFTAFMQLKNVLLVLQ